MFTILIQEKGGEQRRMVFNKPEVTIGRVQGNDIVLPKGNVSKRHARIVLKDGKFIIVDLKSTNGTYVNGRKITSPLVVKDSDKIYIGDFIVGVDEAGGDQEAGPSETTTSPPQERLAPPADVRPDVRPPRPTEAQPMPPSAMPMHEDRVDPMTARPDPSGPIGRADRPSPAAREPMQPRTAPPRPAPAAREPIQPREPAPPRDLPPAAPMPPPAAGPGPQPRGPMGRPGGTMPPPMAPIPPMAQAPMPLGGPGQMPMAPVGGPTMAEPMPMGGPPMQAPMPMGGPPMQAQAPMPMGGPMQQPAPPPMQAPAPPAPAPAPSFVPAPVPAPAHQPQAPVVPLQGGAAAGAAQRRGLVGAGAKKVVGRSVAMPSRRGVQLEPLDPKVVKMLDLQSNILERLRAKLDLDKIPMERLHEEDLWQKAERATIDLVETLETSGELPKYIDQDTLIKEALNEALALGPLEDLLADEAVDEIIIDRRDRVVVGKGGVLRGSGKAFSSDDVFEKVVKRLVAEAGAIIDDAHPLVDLRMRDGTRLTAAVSPVASRGACIVLKKSPAQMPALADLVQQHALSSQMADFLATCVTARRNVLVCGAPGSGKTTLLAALAAASPAGERVVSIEEVAELAIGRDEWIQLETRAAAGRGAEIDLGHLLETALRLAPDRLVVGEVRGREALPLVHALNSSIDGALVAMTGEGAGSALGRLATLARALGGGGWGAGVDGAVRELVAQAFEIVVHVVRGADGNPRVVAIEEVVGITDTAFDSHVLFHHQNNAFSATGTVPRFYSELEARGIPADQAVFR